MFVIIQFIEKIKKSFENDYIVTQEKVCTQFLKRVKLRILYDHKRLNYGNFIEIWDPRNSLSLFHHNSDTILSWNLWNFIKCRIKCNYQITDTLINSLFFTHLFFISFTVLSFCWLLLWCLSVLVMISLLTLWHSHFTNHLQFRYVLGYL